MKDTVEFGRKIRELRLKNDYSLRDLEAKSGVSYSFISSIEKGRFSPSRDTVIALAKALKGSNKNELLLLAGFAPEDPNEDITFSSGKKERPLTELENLFFYELDKLSEEDKKKALEHVRYLRYLAEKANNKD
ncbi:helix-turn-helix transcriptional regulator [Brevibacillus sp. LEMMJ03]|uniref:helix-turn-helix domain-containing protein n=1 Tax=Brevibacillus sp. LEMMJ03 TaxID=2595056 RepID=UPI00117CA688|nr:helix-turn-helix transcriptional regulator [Brevibacillus sp. LEMMJ03]TRY22991.1 helix-turn-helix transcriptional regulator [Brevibacillus sp. LEMMJ03]